MPIKGTADFFPLLRPLSFHFFFPLAVARGGGEQTEQRRRGRRGGNKRSALPVMIARVATELRCTF